MDRHSASISFTSLGSPVLVIKDDKFIFRGVEIHDSGEAYRAFMEVMAKFSDKKNK